MTRNETLTNEQRAEAGYRAVRNYQDGDFDAETGIVDLVVDLLHLAREYGIEPDYIIHTATMHFDVEAEEEDIASLIAAAPDLLKTLEDTLINLEDFLDEDGEFEWTPAAGRSVCRDLEQAIAKARGGA